MSKSISAKHLSEMLFCEGSVTGSRRYSKTDVLNIKKGIEAHKKFERSLQLQPMKIKPKSSIGTINNDTIFKKAPANLTTSKKVDHKVANPIVSFLIIVGTIATYYIATK